MVSAKVSTQVARPDVELRVALTGGIASGKSTVATMFRTRGAAILDADRAAREVVQPGAEGWRRLRDYLGPDYFGEDGQLDRRRLRLRVVADPETRSRVEAILHPQIMAALDAELRNIRRADPKCPVIHDVPLLYEAGFADRFDVVILVYVPPRVQIDRLVRRDGVSPGEAEQTLKIQLPIEDKKQWADHVIDNSGDPGATERQVEVVWQGLFG